MKVLSGDRRVAGASLCPASHQDAVFWCHGWGQPPSQSGLASTCQPGSHWSAGRRLVSDWLVGVRDPSVCRLVAMCGEWRTAGW